VLLLHLHLRLRLPGINRKQNQILLSLLFAVVILQRTNQDGGAESGLGANRAGIA
jgi:hypothetical protein